MSLLIKTQVKLPPKTNVELGTYLFSNLFSQIL